MNAPANCKGNANSTITAVSTRFAEQFSISMIKPSIGPEISLANGHVLEPKSAMEIEIIFQGNFVIGLTLILPLP